MEQNEQQCDQYPGNYQPTGNGYMHERSLFIGQSLVFREGCMTSFPLSSEVRVLSWTMVHFSYIPSGACEINGGGGGG